jgi:hypothetical protein
MYPVYIIGKENSENVFHARHTRMCQLVTLGKLSNNVNTTGTGSMRVVASRLQSHTADQHRFRTQYGCQLPTWKSIRFWDNKLRTTGSLLHVKSPGKTRTSEENVTRIIEVMHCRRKL